MNELTTNSSQYMTTKEIAIALNVGLSTLKRAVEKLGPVLGAVLTNNQGGYLFTAEQVTIIKQEIQKHHNLASRQIDSVSTELEMKKKAAEVITWYMTAYEDEKEKRIEAESTLNLLNHSKETFTFTAIAKELGRPSRGFGDFLHSEGYIYKQNGVWLPYYGKEAFFETRSGVTDNGFSYYTTNITAKGRIEILKKYGGKND